LLRFARNDDVVEVAINNVGIPGSVAIRDRPGM